MYHNKETFKALAERTSSTLQFEYLVKMLGNMTQNKDAIEVVKAAFQSSTPRKLDNTRCYDILAHQIYGKDWNFISNQFKRNEKRLIKSHQFLASLKKNSNFDVLSFEKDEYSKLNDVELFKKFVELFEFKNADVNTINFDNHFECGHLMKGNLFQYIVHFLVVDRERCCHTVSVEMIVDSSNGCIKEFKLHSTGNDIDIDDRKLHKFVGRKYKSLHIDEDSKTNYYLVLKNRIDDKDYWQLVETLPLDEDDAIIIADDLSKTDLGNYLGLYDDYHLSPDFAWNKVDGEPVVCCHGGNKILVPVKSA